jgi:hypothetical protein
MWLAVAFVALWSSVAVGQVYESKDKSGAPVFSDQPSPGAKPVELPPPNVVSPQHEPMPTPPPSPPAFSYAKLAFVAPTEKSTIHSNTGAFDVQLSVEPHLRASDSFVLTLDGKTLSNHYTSGNIALTAQDYAAAAADTYLHSLSAAVVDSNDKVLISAGPVGFYVRHAAVDERRHRAR